MTTSSSPSNMRTRHVTACLELGITSLVSAGLVNRRDMVSCVQVTSQPRVKQRINARLFNQTMSVSESHLNMVAREMEVSNGSESIPEALRSPIRQSKTATQTISGWVQEVRV
jgi:hypothetical protein